MGHPICQITNAMCQIHIYIYICIYNLCVSIITSRFANKSAFEFWAAVFVVKYNVFRTLQFSLLVEKRLHQKVWVDFGIFEFVFEVTLHGNIPAEFCFVSIFSHLDFLFIV